MERLPGRPAPQGLPRPTTCHHARKVTSPPPHRELGAACDGARGGSLDRAAFWLVALVACSVHWIPHLPPQADLSQHAGQIRFLHDWMQPGFAYRDILELNFFTPYLPAYLVGAALCALMPAVAAVKLVWSVASLGTVLMSVRVRERLGGDARWDWLVLPGLFGVAYHWGMLTFMFAVPFGLAALRQWLVLRGDPSWRRALAFGVALLALFFAHSLVTAWVLLVAGGIVLSHVLQGTMTVRSAGRSVIPLIMPVPLMLAWMLFVRAAGAQANAPVAWLPSDYRIGGFVLQWLGIPGPEALITVAGALLLLAPIVAGARLQHAPEAIMPLLVTLAIVLLGPADMLGNTVTSSRFYVLLGPSVVFALQTPQARRRALMAAGAVVRVATVACVMIAGRLALRFSVEQRDAVQLLREIPPRAHVLSIVPDGSSTVYGSPWTYQHFPVWYQAETGGLVEFSFAALYPMIVRFRRDYADAVPVRFTADSLPQPRTLQLRSFDFIVARRSTRRPASALDIPGTLVVEHGAWQLYRLHAPGAR